MGHENDLTAAATWENVGLYTGLIVAVQETGKIFVLKDKDGYTSKSNWIPAGSNATYSIVVLPTHEVTNEVGETIESNISKRYQLVRYEGETSTAVGDSIDIPRDLVVSKGEVKTIDDVPTIVLTLNNGDVLKIPASDLVEYITVDDESTPYITIDDDNQLKINIDKFALSSDIKKSAAELPIGVSITVTSEVTDSVGNNVIEAEFAAETPVIQVIEYMLDSIGVLKDGLSMATQGGITAIAPANGETVISVTGTGNERRLSMKISEASGNILEKREDGLYATMT